MRPTSHLFAAVVATGACASAHGGALDRMHTPQCLRFMQPIGYTATGAREKGDSAWYVVQLDDFGKVARPLFLYRFERESWARSSHWTSNGDSLHILVFDGLEGWEISLRRERKGYAGVASYLSDAIVVGQAALHMTVEAVAISCPVGPQARGVAVQSLVYRGGNVIPSGMLSSRPSLDSLLVKWYSGQLSALHEGRMAESVPTGTPAAYRFIWLRSFHHPVVVRVYASKNGAIAVTSTGAGAGGYDPGPIVRRDSVVVGNDDWRGLTYLMDRERLWERPAVDTTRMGNDGAEWVVEGLQGSRYTIVSRWSPSDTGATAFMHRLGDAFLHVGRVVVPRSEMY